MKMKIQLITLVSLFYLYSCALLLIAHGSEAKAIGNLEELESGLSEPDKKLFENDLDELEHAIEEEVQEETPTHLTLEDVSHDVQVHNEAKPWYVRLGQFLRDNFGDLIRRGARAAIVDFIIPQVTKAIFGAAGR